MPNQPDVLTQIVHKSDNLAGNVSYVANGFRALTGLQAFRSYDWMIDARALNTAGDFRGMVISARWATVYNVIGPVANAIGNIATVASLTAVVMDMAPQFERVYNSKASATSKAQQYSLLTSIVAQKTLAGIVTGGVHLIYLPLIAGCNALGKAGGGGPVSKAGFECSQVIQNADALVQQSVNYLTDPANQQRVIQNVLTIQTAN
jgi:hypothetical protein